MLKAKAGVCVLGQDNLGWDGTSPMCPVVALNISLPTYFTHRTVKRLNDICVWCNSSYLQNK